VKTEDTEMNGRMHLRIETAFNFFVIMSEVHNKVLLAHNRVQWRALGSTRCVLPVIATLLTQARRYALASSRLICLKFVREKELCYRVYLLHDFSTVTLK